MSGNGARLVRTIRCCAIQNVPGLQAKALAVNAAGAQIADLLGDHQRILPVDQTLILKRARGIHAGLPALDLAGLRVLNMMCVQ